jgi:hypothetical protein
VPDTLESLPTSLDIGVTSAYEFFVALSLLMEMQSLLGLAVTHAELDQKSGNEVLQISLAVILTE